MRELAAFAQFGSDLDDATKAKLERGKRIVEVFKQPQFKPGSVPMQGVTLWAVQNGYFDDVEVDDLKATQEAIGEYMTDRKAEIIKKISDSGKLDDALEAELKGALDEYKAANK